MIRRGVVACLACVPMVLFGKLLVGPLAINFLPKGGNSQYINVSNPDKFKNAYVDLQLYRVHNPGTSESYREPLANNPMTFGMIVSERKMVIPPQGLQRIRVIRLLGPQKKDVVYQLLITPENQQLERIQQKEKMGKRHYHIGLTINLAYAARIVVRPKNAKPYIVISRKGNMVTARNLGNTTALLTQGKQCSAKDKCQFLPMGLQVHRLYAGNVWQFTAPKAEPVLFIQRYLNQDSKVRSQ